MRILICIFLILSFSCKSLNSDTNLQSAHSNVSNFKLAPPSFIHEDKNIVWSDFINAEYNLEFDVKDKKATSYTKITLKTSEKGYPVFDLVSSPNKILIDGELTTQQEISTPSQETKIRFINKELIPGTYTIEIYSPIEHGVTFKEDTVSALFSMKDLKDREFLEKYLPTNFEYDQYKMKLSIVVANSQKEHILMTNGKKMASSNNEFIYEFPAYFNTSSIFIHLFPKGSYSILSYKTNSIDGRSIPIIIYSPYIPLNLYNNFIKAQINSIFKELENDYGPWPHPHLIWLGKIQLRGGMEYAGAAVSGILPIGHELQHNYFARAVMPANGNAGWIDEGVARWSDFFSLKDDNIDYDHGNIGGQSPYHRKTAKGSYQKGRYFMQHIHYLLSKRNKSGLKGFLKYFYNKRKFTVITTKDFQSDLESYYGENLDSIFNKHIYGK